MKWFNWLMIPAVLVLVILFIPTFWENTNLTPSNSDLVAGKIILGISAILFLIDMFIIGKLTQKHHARTLTDDDNLWMWLIGISLLFLSTLLTPLIALVPNVGWTIVCILIGLFPVLFIAAMIKIKIDEHKQSKISKEN